MAKTNVTTEGRSKKWYVRRGKKSAGPVESSFIIRGAKLGRLLRTDELSVDGKQWRKAGEYRLPFLKPQAAGEMVKKPAHRSSVQRDGRQNVEVASGVPLPPPPVRRNVPSSVVPPPLPVKNEVRPIHNIIDIHSEATPDARHDNTDHKLTFEIRKRKFVGTSSAELTLTPHELTNTLENQDTIVVQRQLHSIRSRMTFQKLERTSGLYVILVLLGPVGWVFLAIVLAKGLKSRLTVDGKRYLVPEAAANALEAWGSAGWISAKIKRHARNFGWGGVAWGIIHCVSALSPMDDIPSAIKSSAEYQWIVQCATIESVLVLVLGLAMAAVGVVCIARFSCFFASRH